MVDALRQWISLIETVYKLEEAVESVTIMGNSVQVIRNPSETQLIAASKRQPMRGLVDHHSGDTYWWSSREAIHLHMAAALGLGDDIYSSIGNARMELRGKRIHLQGYIGAIEHSRSLRYLTSPDKTLRIASGKQALTLDEWIAKPKRRRGIV